jgi:ComF family protein
MKMQSALRLVYPSQCLTCDALTESDFALCGACWRDTPFIGGLVCDACGVPLPGDDDGGIYMCDDCMSLERPWSQGRAALLYKDNARRLVLSLKHGDRTELADAVTKWMVEIARPMVQPNMIVAPVPLHWSRLLYRRYNQAALLARPIASALGLLHVPDLLQRTRKTARLDGHSREERFAALQNAIRIHPKRTNHIEGKSVLLVDDVMTSGATLTACTEALLRSRAREVCVVTLARAAKDT